MLIPLVAHQGQMLAPHDLWTAWNLSPALLAALAAAVWAYRRGHQRGPRRDVDRRRRRYFTAALVVIVVALVSPLDALSGTLASAHMVQHVLLLLVAAPLLALSAPSSALLRGSPLAVRRASGAGRRRLRLTWSRLRVLRHPTTVWLLHVATIWIWHAAVPYGAALASTPVHALEHATFLITAVLFWRVVVGARAAGRVSAGLGVLLVFAMALQSVFLAMLLTFARAPWYAGYDATTVWGLEALADQQLAGVIMWIPAGFLYVAAGLSLAVAWLREAERSHISA